MNETAQTTTTTAQAIAPSLALGPSLLQAVAALLLVVGLIFLTSYLLRRFAFGGQLSRGLKRTKVGPSLMLTESLWVDARHRVVTISDRTDSGRRYTILLGPQAALQLQDAHALQTSENYPGLSDATISDIVS